MSYAHPIDRYSFTPRRASPTEAELSRAAASFGLLNRIAPTLRVREISGVMFLQICAVEYTTDGPTFDVVRMISLGAGKEAARVNLAIELWNLATELDQETETEIEPDPAPSIVSRVSGWFTRALVAVAPLATATAFLVCALH